MTTAMGFKRAQRTAVKLKVLAMGPSGAGKTYAALHIAHGIAPGKIALIDSENDRSGYYADVLPFDSLSLDSHTPKDYIAAIDLAVANGYEVVVIDSLAHAWQNVLDRKTQYERANPKANSYTTWGTFGAEWERLIRHILDVNVHIIATSRSKQAYEQVTDSNGKKKVEKLGMQPMLRDGAEYEFALVFDIQPSHMAQCTKDNTGLFDQDAMQMWNLCDGSVSKLLREWLTTAKPAAPKPAPAPVVDDANKPSAEQVAFLEKLLRSHVFADEERAKITRNAPTKERMTKAIEYVQGQIALRKAAEKDAAKSASATHERADDEAPDEDTTDDGGSQHAPELEDAAA